MHAFKPVISTLLNTRGKKYKICCLKIKHCKYLQNWLQFLSHIMVTKEIWGLI